MAIKKVVINICALLLIISVIPFLNIIGGLYYAAIAILFFIICSNIRYVQINRCCLLFLLICSFSIVFNDIPSEIKPYQRFLLYFIIYIVFGPLFYNEKTNQLRLNIFFLLIKFCVIITLVSILAFLIWGIGIDKKDLGFKGITGYSMMMAPIAAISTFYLIYLLRFRHAKWAIFLILISLFTMLIAGSRSALAAFLVSFLFSLFKESKRKFFRLVLISIPILVISFPLWKSQLAVFEKKQEIQERMDDGENSRTIKWNNRLYEFKNNPIIGVGFSSLDIRHSAGDYSKSEGTLEPGSSWLALLSMTGILGFFSFFCLYFISVKDYLMNKLKSHLDILVFQLLVFFGLHFIFDGYLFGIGSILLVIFLLSMSLSSRYTKIVWKCQQ